MSGVLFGLLWRPSSSSLMHGIAPPFWALISCTVLSFSVENSNFLLTSHQRNTENSLQLQSQSSHIDGSLPNIFKPYARLPASLLKNSKQCTVTSSTHVDPTPKYIELVILSLLAKLCAPTLLRVKLTNLPIYSLGLGISLPNSMVYLTTSNTVQRRRQRSSMPWSYLHTLQSCYPSNHSTVLTNNTTNSIKKYPRICTSRQGSKVLNRQRHLKFQHNTSLRTRALISAGPH